MNNRLINLKTNYKNKDKKKFHQKKKMNKIKQI